MGQYGGGVDGYSKSASGGNKSNVSVGYSIKRASIFSVKSATKIEILLKNPNSATILSEFFRIALSLIRHRKF